LICMPTYMDIDPFEVNDEYRISPAHIRTFYQRELRL
jgi:hypothetical protein